MLINETTREYIRQHENEDVRKLALHGTKDKGVDLPMALQQIAGRQTARRKLPSWAAADGIVYPPHLNMEQCSSEQTAKYKAGLVSDDESLLSGYGKEHTFVDLTGGFGVDFYWMSQGFKKRVYIEQNSELCAISSENFRLLGLECSICCCDTATYLAKMEKADVIYLDPARRNEHGGRTYSIEDCTPNVLELLPLLLEKAEKIILKLSPMLDWRKAVEDLKYVSEVHIISVNNECKELLLVLGRESKGLQSILCVNDNSVFRWFPPQKTKVSAIETIGFHRGNHRFPLWKPNGKTIPADNVQYLYEPNASIMKAGCFMAVEEQYPVQQLSPNSHLFMSSVEIGDFPGRRFQICAVSSMNKQELKETLQGVEKANIAVRNFPLSVEQLRKKLKIKDGGYTYLFATTLADGQHRLFICRKIG